MKRTRIFHWQKVEILIYSTHNALQLTKHVLPELVVWCAKWKLFLADTEFVWFSSEQFLEETKAHHQNSIYLFVFSEKQKLFKNHLLSKKNCHNYCFIEQETFNATKTKEELKQIISSLFQKRITSLWQTSKDFWEIQRDNHEFYAAFTSKNFIGRADNIKKLSNYVKNNKRKCYVVYAGKGVGASALLGHFFLSLKNTKQKVTIISYFSQSTKLSNSTSFLLRRLIHELQQAHHLKSYIPKNENCLVDVFLETLKEVKHSTVIIIDCLDDFPGENLLWLPDKLPKKVKIIVSTRKHINTNKVLLDLTKQHHILTYFARQEKREFLRQRLPHHFCKNQEHLENLVCAISGQASCLSLIVEILKKSGPLSIDNIVRNVEESYTICLSQEKLWNKNFEYIEQEYEQTHPGLISLLLFFLYCSKEGLSYQELEQLMLEEDAQFAHQSILYQFMDSLCYNNELISIGDLKLQKAIESRICEEEKIKCHNFLAQYFAAQPLYFESKKLNRRKLQEQLWHQICSFHHKAVVETLSNIEFLEAKIKTGMISQLQEEIRCAVKIMPKDFCCKVFSQIEINRDILEQIEKILTWQKDFLERYPQSLFQTMWNYGYWYDCPQAKGFYKGAGPWDFPGPKLYRLVEHWRMQMSLVWFKSLRPLPPIGFSCVVRKFGKENGFVSIDISDQGKIAAASEGSFKYIWNYYGKPLHTLEYAYYNSICFSPMGDKVATGAMDGTVWVRDVETGKLLHENQYKQQITKVKFSPDGKMIIASYGRKINVFKLENKKAHRILEHKRPHDTFISFDIDPSGTKIIALTKEGEISKWDIASGQKLFAKKHKEFTSHIRFNNDATLFATVNCAYGVHLWDAEKGEKIYRLFKHKEIGNYTGVVFTPNNDYMAFSIDQRIELWDLEQKTLIQKLEQNSEILSLNISEDGKKLVCGTMRGEVYIYNLGEIKPKYFLEEQAKTIYAMRCGINEVVTCDYKEAHIWDVNTGKISNKIKFKEGFANIYLGDNGSKIICEYEEHFPEVWDTNTGSFLHRLKVKGKIYGVYNNLLATYRNSQMIFWDIIKNQKICSLEQTAEMRLFFSFSPDGSKIAMLLADGAVNIWCTQSGKLLCHFDVDTITDPPIWSKDGSKILVQHYQLELFLIDIKSQNMQTFPCDEYIQHAVFNEEILVFQTSEKIHSICLETKAHQHVTGECDLEAFFKALKSTYQVIEKYGTTQVRKNLCGNKAKMVACFPDKVATKMVGEKMVAFCGDYLYLLEVCGIEKD